MRVVRPLILAAIAGFAAAPAGATPTASHTIWRIAGTGLGCAAAPQCGDGGAAFGAAIGFPQAVALGPGGEIYVADLADNEVRRVSPGGVVSIVAGDGTPCQTAPACGDGGPATSAQLNAPTGVAVDSHGAVFIADAGDDEIREVASDGTITRIAGTGAECTGGATCGDGGSARSARLASPDGVAIDRHGNVYIADSADNQIRRIDAHGTITTVAGDGSECSAAPACGDAGPATSAQLSYPESVAVDARGNLFIADNGDNEIRRVDAHGTITRLAGTGAACATAPKCGDGGPAPSAALNAPEGVAVDASGRVAIADWGDNEVRIVSTGGTILRVAGTGTACALPPVCGDTGPAGSAQLSSPDGVAVDSAGNVVIGDTYDNELRLVPGTVTAPARAGGAALLALSALAGRSTVAVSAVLSAPARVSLSVARGTAGPLLVVHSSSAAGLIALDWNRHLKSRVAPHGRYRLIVSARFGHTLVSSQVDITL